MQNFFLSPHLGRLRTGNGWKAQEALIKHAIPAARKQGIRIIWLNWGLTQREIEEMPPATLRAFGFEKVEIEREDGSGVDEETLGIDEHGVGEKGIGRIKKEEGSGAKEVRARIYKGLGTAMGDVDVGGGQTVDAGRLLMRDTWNAALTPELEAVRKSEDVWIHKNRMSGLWGTRTECTDFLDKEGIRTLIFAGVNTDQCVGGSLQDAFTKGYDCVLLSDGCGTSSPDAAQQCVEWNVERTWGFLMSCKDMADGVVNTE